MNLRGRPRLEVAAFVVGALVTACAAGMVLRQWWSG